jgi:hypothetical protein
MQLILNFCWKFIFLVRSVARIEYRLLVAHFVRESAVHMENLVGVAHVLRKVKLIE